MQNQCPKCGKSIKSKNPDLNPDLLGLIFLFGNANIKNKKAVCDVCGSRLKKK